MSNLLPLQSSIGQPANSEKHYFPRDAIVKKIFRKLDNGENLLISAPRRIGKSTILKYIEKNPEENQIIKYMIVQSVDSQEEFFKKFFNVLIDDKEIFEGITGYLKRASSSVSAYADRIKGISIGGSKIELGTKESINYYEECIKLIESFKTEKKIIIFIDEFPDALNNIITKDKELAIKFLQLNRDMRMFFSDKNLQFVYTGSTGLKNVVKKLKKLDLINDIQTIPVLPFSEDEARELIKRLILGFREELDAFNLDDEVIEYILHKITWRLPYYMQIIVEELFEHYENTQNEINHVSVDFILSEIVKSKSNHSDYFENWKDRLNKAFDKIDYDFAIEVLNYISKNNYIEYAVFHDLSVRHMIEDYKYVLDVLEHDGYISENDKKYGFNSILLKEWWFINVAT